jgi:hypothetical protein
MRLNPLTLLLACLAAAGAAWLSEGQSTPSYDEAMVGVVVQQSFGDAAAQIATEPLDIQALLLDYADNEPLLLKARIALMRYPNLARRILPLYGGEPEFQEVLLQYGEAALPPIGYFMDNDLISLKVRRALSERIEDAKLLYGRLVGTPEGDTAAIASVPELTAEERGWYAIQLLREDGYDFLGQFVVARNGKAHWLQTERVMEDVSGFFLGGVRGLETKWRQGEKIEGSDLGWAGLDVIVIGSTVKLLKAVRGARAAAPGANAAQAGNFSRRMAVFGSHALARGGRLAIAVASYGAIPAAIYLMIRYPRLINATLAELGDWLGITPWLVQFVFWFVALAITMRLALYLLSPLSWVLRSLGWVVGALEVWFRPVRPQRHNPHLI